MGPACIIKATENLDSRAKIVNLYIIQYTKSFYILNTKILNHNPSLNFLSVLFKFFFFFKKTNTNFLY